MSKNNPGKPMEKRGEPKGDWKVLEILHPDAAGIDIGGSEHWVAIAPERDEKPVRSFDCFTPDLEEMADWLVAHGVKSVAMQSTGVYWIPVFEILQQRGLEDVVVERVGPAVAVVARPRRGRQVDVVIEGRGVVEVLEIRDEELLAPPDRCLELA